jgi:hypothetical protein
MDETTEKQARNFLLGYGKLLVTLDETAHPTKGLPSGSATMFNIRDAKTRLQHLLSKRTYLWRLFLSPYHKLATVSMPLVTVTAYLLARLSRDEEDCPLTRVIRTCRFACKDLDWGDYLKLIDWMVKRDFARISDPRSLNPSVGLTKDMLYRIAGVNSSADSHSSCASRWMPELDAWMLERDAETHANKHTGRIDRTDASKVLAELKDRHREYIANRIVGSSHSVGIKGGLELAGCFFDVTLASSPKATKRKKTRD